MTLPSRIVTHLLLQIFTAISLRLQGPSSAYGSGRVEVYFAGEWGTICSGYRWDRNDAAVVCRQLGYVNAVRVLHPYYVPDGSGKIWLTNVHCNGNEQKLSNCSHGGWGNNYCGHNNDVGVVCSSTGKFTVILKRKSGNFMHLHASELSALQEAFSI